MSRDRVPSLAVLSRCQRYQERDGIPPGTSRARDRRAEQMPELSWRIFERARHGLDVDMLSKEHVKAGIESVSFGTLLYFTLCQVIRGASDAVYKTSSLSFKRSSRPFAGDLRPRCLFWHSLRDEQEATAVCYTMQHTGCCPR